MRELDVLDLAAREHRLLQRRLRSVVDGVGHGRREAWPSTIREITSEVARHEAIDRLLLYPLVGRDGYGRRSLVDRRAEQRSISDQLAKAVRASEPPDGDLLAVLSGMQLTFIGHSDREEIEDFPHARRLSSRDERQDLAALRSQLGRDLQAQMPTVPVPAVRGDGRDGLGPIQATIAGAKEILLELDRSRAVVS